MNQPLQAQSLSVNGLQNHNWMVIILTRDGFNYFFYCRLLIFESNNKEAKKNKNFLPRFPFPGMKDVDPWVHSRLPLSCPWRTKNFPITLSSPSHTVLFAVRVSAPWILVPSSRVNPSSLGYALIVSKFRNLGTALAECAGVHLVRRAVFFCPTRGRWLIWVK